ncbi:hypothetical protein ACFQXA_30815 [Nocardiopsis composta]
MGCPVPLPGCRTPTVRPRSTRDGRPGRSGSPGGELSAIGCPVRLRHARGGALATYALAERTARLTPGAVLSGQDDPDRVPTPATGAAVPHFLAGD